MIQSSLDILYIVLAVGLGMVFIALTFLIIEVMRVFKRVNTISGLLEEILHHVNIYARIPATVLYNVIDWVKKNWK